MTTIREHALDAWAREQEKSRQAEQKKLKRKAKKIEEEIDELLPKDWDHCEFERDLAHPEYKIVVNVTEADGTTRFTYDEKDELAIIGECLACHKETISTPVTSAAKLGQLLERFESGQSHECSETGSDK